MKKNSLKFFFLEVILSDKILTGAVRQFNIDLNLRDPVPRKQLPINPKLSLESVLGGRQKKEESICDRAIFISILQMKSEMKRICGDHANFQRSCSLHGPLSSGFLKTRVNSQPCLRLH